MELKFGPVNTYRIQVVEGERDWLYTCDDDVCRSVDGSLNSRIFLNRSDATEGLRWKYREKIKQGFDHDMVAYLHTLKRNLDDFREATRSIAEDTPEVEEDEGDGELEGLLCLDEDALIAEIGPAD